jgi:hypothetical protein
MSGFQLDSWHLAGERASGGCNLQVEDEILALQGAE